jgi:hypothetical protein
MKIKSLAIACAAIAATSLPLVSTQAQAASDINPWSECGLGSLVFPTVPVGAIISNLIWDLGTTAITTSLVSPETCKGKKMAAAVFIGTTYSSLETETVIGEGQYMTALADVMGCDKAVQAPLFTEVRSRFKETMALPGYTEKSKNQKAETFYNIVDKAVTTKFAAKCNLA